MSRFLFLYFICQGISFGSRMASFIDMNQKIALLLSLLTQIHYYHFDRPIWEFQLSNAEFRPANLCCSLTQSDSLTRHCIGTWIQHKQILVNVPLLWGNSGTLVVRTYFKCSGECGFLGFHSPPPNQLRLRNIFNYFERMFLHSRFIQALPPASKLSFTRHS